MHTVLIVTCSLVGVLLLSIAVLVPFYEFKWKPQPTSSAIVPKVVRQLQVQPFFSPYFLNMKDVNGNSLEKMYELKTDVYGCVFTLDADQSLIGIDGTNTFRNLREWTGGSLHETVPYINSIQHDVSIATDKQINAYLAVATFIPCGTQSRGCYYIKTDSAGNRLGLYLGYISDGMLIPIINKHYGYDVSNYPNTIFICTQDKYTLSETIFTSAYDVSYGPYVTGTITDTVNMFILRMPNLYMLNQMNTIDTSSGVINPVRDLIPASVVSKCLNPGYSIVFYDQARLFFGSNTNKNCRLPYAPNDVRDEYSFMTAKPGQDGLVTVLQQCVYNNKTKEWTESIHGDLSILIQGVATLNPADVIDLKQVFADSNISFPHVTAKQCQVPTLRNTPVLPVSSQTESDKINSIVQAELYSKLTSISFFNQHRLYIWIGIGSAIAIVVTAVVFWLMYALSK